MSILNHAYKQIITAIVAKIPSTHLIVDVIVLSNDEDGQLSVPITSIFLTNHNESSQNHAMDTSGKIPHTSTIDHSIVTIQNINFFILCTNLT